MKATTRKLLGLVVGILLYYVVHEGAHLILALFFDVFKEIKFLQLGVQIVITDPGALTDLQLAIFNIAGAVASLIVAYLLVLSAKRICRMYNKVGKAIGYYVTILFLLNDPFYLSVLCGFFGGGDMNGIVMFGISEMVARLAFGVLGLINLCIIFRYIVPVYKAGFASLENN